MKYHSFRQYQTATGWRPDIIVAKLNQPIVAALVERANTPAESLWMALNRLYADIQNRITKTLLLSGEIVSDNLTSAVHHPDFSMRILVELTGLLHSLRT